MGPRLSFLFAETSIHGLKHLRDESEGWRKSFKRIFWTTFLVLSFFFMVRMIQSMFIKQDSSTEINVDTAYRDFDNVFPAVSICLTKGRATGQIKDLVGTEFTTQDGKKIKVGTRHFRAMQGYLFMSYNEPLEGISLDICSDLNDTCGIDFHTIRNKLTPVNCSEFIEKMTFLEKEVNCVDYFERFHTEVGICYIANSLYSKNADGGFKLKDFTNLQMRYKNTDNVERSLEIRYKDSDFYAYKLIIHSPEELPDGVLPHSNLKKIGGMTSIALKTVEFHNQPDVIYEPIKARQCRFPSERFEELNLPYSYNSCKYLKRVNMELKTCNCTLPTLLDNHNLKMCMLVEFPCIDELTKKLKQDIKNLTKLMDYIGDCLVPTCVSMEINKIGEYDLNVNSTEYGVLKIEIMSPPTLRYIRRASFTRLDMIVQSGGIIGLFFGASVLSIIEVFYLIFRMFRINN